MIDAVVDTANFPVDLCLFFLNMKHSFDIAEKGHAP